MSESRLSACCAKPAQPVSIVVLVRWRSASRISQPDRAGEPGLDREGGGQCTPDGTVAHGGAGRRAGQPVGAGAVCPGGTLYADRAAWGKTRIGLRCIDGASLERLAGAGAGDGQTCDANDVAAGATLVLDDAVLAEVDWASNRCWRSEMLGQTATRALRTEWCCAREWSGRHRCRVGSRSVSSPRGQVFR
jgi:hypothetical protein